MGRFEPYDLFCGAPTWRQRGMAFLRACGFLLLAGLLASLCAFAVARLTGSVSGVRRFGPLSAVGEGLSFAIVFLATVVMAGLTGQALARYGWRMRRAGRRLCLGLAVGMGFLVLQLALSWAVGLVSFDRLALAAAHRTLFSAGLLAVFFLGVGLFEETLLRGYLLVELSRAISFWPAAIVLGAGFGALHLVNGGESLMGIVAAGLFGLAMAVLFRLTGSLWLSIGIHSGWDFAQSVLGVPNSGVSLSLGLLHATANGPAWLSGGPTGPEGSVLILIPLAGFLGVGWLVRDRRPNTELRPAR